MTISLPTLPTFATAPGPRSCGPCVPLVVISPEAAAAYHGHLADLPTLLEAGDVVVVNDAGTLPASLQGHTQAGDAIELRLSGPLPEPLHEPVWQAVIFGEGDWREDTDLRPGPPELREGDVLELGPELRATVLGRDPVHPRLITVAFDREGEALWRALYTHGQPIRYSYLGGPTQIADHQTPYAGRPWAVEMPSAGRALTPELIAALRDRGVAVVALTHAAGLSATGDAELDAALPLPERSEIPEHTVQTVLATRARGSRVLAVGTSVVRALEGRVADAGRLLAGDAVTAHLLGPGVPLRVVDGVLAGLHAPGESHFRLLQAFVPEARLEAATVEAALLGYQNHEFGDSSLVWRHPAP